MNDINMLAKLADDAKCFSVKEGDKEKQLISFSVLDFGTSGRCENPIYMEVHFVKDVGARLLPYLKKDKEVYIHGFMVNKRYTTTKGIDKEKLYLSADYIYFPGESPKEEEVA